MAIPGFALLLAFEVINEISLNVPRHCNLDIKVSKTMFIFISKKVKN